jgi:hypothetical protein
VDRYDEYTALGLGHLARGDDRRAEGRTQPLLDLDLRLQRRDREVARWSTPDG